MHLCSDCGADLRTQNGFAVMECQCSGYSRGIALVELDFYLAAVELTIMPLALRRSTLRRSVAGRPSHPT